MFRFFPKKAILFTALLMAPYFVACGVGPDPAADGAHFSRTFHYYYGEDCRFIGSAVYDCEALYTLSPSYRVSLRVDSDGLASLNLDGDFFYYTASEYYEDPYVFEFYEDDQTVIVDRHGEELSFWDDFNNTVTFYYAYLPE